MFNQEEEAILAVWTVDPFCQGPCVEIFQGCKAQGPPTCGKAGHPWHLQKPDGGGRCLHSSGEWNTGGGAVAGLWEHRGLPGSPEACQQPLSDQRGGSGPKGLCPQPSPTQEFSFSTIPLLTQVVDWEEKI